MTKRTNIVKKYIYLRCTNQIKIKLAVESTQFALVSSSHYVLELKQSLINMCVSISYLFKAFASLLPHCLLLLHFRIHCGLRKICRFGSSAKATFAVI